MAETESGVFDCGSFLQHNLEKDSSFIFFILYLMFQEQLCGILNTINYNPWYILL